jgi:L-lysine exporter family protein LysE/ArgO
MSIGVLGLGSVVAQSQILYIVLSLLGAGFLFLYGLNAFVSSYKGGNAIVVNDSNDDFKKTIKKSVLMTLAITLLNPHVYIDTVLVIGSISADFSLYQKVVFLTGALLSSFIWFFGLGYGSRLLIPLFKNQTTWRVLDAFIGIIVWWIAFHLLYML